jgi:hypothetical protein
MLSFGYFLVFHNLCKLLGVNSSEFYCRVTPQALTIKTGPWVDLLKFPNPDKIWRMMHEVEVPFGNHTLEVDFHPRFAVVWKQKVASRKFFFHGE